MTKRNGQFEWNCPQAQIPIFGYGNISTIAPKREPIRSPVVPILANISSPSKGPLHDEQVANVASASKLRAPQYSPPLNAIEALKWSPVA